MVDWAFGFDPHWLFVFEPVVRVVLFPCDKGQTGPKNKSTRWTFLGPCLKMDHIGDTHQAKRSLRRAYLCFKNSKVAVTSQTHGPGGKASASETNQLQWQHLEGKQAKCPWDRKKKSRHLWRKPPFGGTPFWVTRSSVGEYPPPRTMKSASPWWIEINRLQTTKRRAT